MDEVLLRDAHTHSMRHRDELRRSETCGCFHCTATFGYERIQDWSDDGDTALCPVCGIDAVIGSDSGIEITTEFLAAMKAYWF